MGYLKKRYRVNEALSEAFIPTMADRHFVSRVIEMSYTFSTSSFNGNIMYELGSSVVHVLCDSQQHAHLYPCLISFVVLCSVCQQLECFIVVLDVDCGVAPLYHLNTAAI